MGLIGSIRSPNLASPAEKDVARPVNTSRNGLPARHAAVTALQAIVERNMPLDEALELPEARFSRLDGRDRAFARAIVMCALRRRGQIDALLSSFMKKPLPRKSGPARQILAAGAAQLVFMETPPHAAIDLSVRLAAKDRNSAGFKGLINAVLRRVSREGRALVAEQDAARLNTPDWLWHRWSAAYGEEAARRIAARHLVEPPVDVTVRAEQQDWADRLGATRLASGSLRLASAGRIEDLSGYDEGAWWIQDAAAALPARLLGDVAGKHVLDLCAAPGGKTLQLAAAGANVTAVDRSAQRLERLHANLARTGLSATVVTADAAAFAPETPPDAILLDAPCSATGTIRRHPDIACLRREDAIESLAVLQTRLLDHAASLLAPGGRLVYCTCSLEPEEGEARVADLLDRHADVRRVPILPGEVPGFEAAVCESGDLRILPFHLAVPDGVPPGNDGFFVTRLERLAVPPNR